VARIFNFPKPGASTEMKDPSEVPVANPLGSWPTEPMYSRYSSTPENSGSVSGVSIDDATLLAVVTPKDLVADGDDETVNADERAAAITESVNRNIEVYHTIVDSLFFFLYFRDSHQSLEVNISHPSVFVRRKDLSLVILLCPMLQHIWYFFEISSSVVGVVCWCAPSSSRQVWNFTLPEVDISTPVTLTTERDARLTTKRKDCMFHGSYLYVCIHT
jgi:hypothetical protein